MLTIQILCMLLAFMCVLADAVGGSLRHVKLTAAGLMFYFASLFFGLLR